MKKISKAHGNIIINLLKREHKANYKRIITLKHLGEIPFMTVEYCDNYYKEIINEVKRITKKY